MKKVRQAQSPEERHMSQNPEISQFGKPIGEEGEEVGRLMADGNAAINAWTISLLDIRAKDKVLEIGFGPGVAIQELDQISLTEFIAGIDHSEVMVAQAVARNARAIQAGRVELRLGSVSELPYENTTFDKVYSVNSFQFWPELQTDLAEIKRTMKRNGLIAITIQPRWVTSEQMVKEVGDQLIQSLSKAGFNSIRLEKKELEPMSAVCVLGFNS